MANDRKYFDGQQFGSWTIVTAYPGDNDVRAKCRCDCGTVRMIPRANLHPERLIRCRKCWLELRSKFTDGQKFGSWTIITAYPGGPSALCRCVCGTVKHVQRGALAYGISKSCMRCRRDWRNRLVGRKLGTRTIVAVDDDQAVLQCSKCDTKTVCSIAYVRNKRVNNPRCGRCDVIASTRALITTGVSRQAIHARVAAGWTRVEATTTPKGELPPRIAALRAQNKEEAHVRATEG